MFTSALMFGLLIWGLKEIDLWPFEELHFGTCSGFIVRLLLYATCLNGRIRVIFKCDSRDYRRCPEWTRTASEIQHKIFMRYLWQLKEYSQVCTQMFHMLRRTDTNAHLCHFILSLCCLIHSWSSPSSSHRAVLELSLTLSASSWAQQALTVCLGRFLLSPTHNRLSRKLQWSFESGKLLNSF